MKPKDFNALPSAKVRFIEPMYALAVQQLPHGQEWLYEVKFDGYRCLAGKDANGLLFGPGGETFLRNNSRKSPEPVKAPSANTFVKYAS